MGGELVMAMDFRMREFLVGGVSLNESVCMTAPASCTCKELFLSTPKCLET